MPRDHQFMDYEEAQRRLSDMVGWLDDTGNMAGTQEIARDYHLDATAVSIGLDALNEKVIRQSEGMPVACEWEDWECLTCDEPRMDAYLVKATASCVLYYILVCPQCSAVQFVKMAEGRVNPSWEEQHSAHRNQGRRRICRRHPGHQARDSHQDS